MVPILSLTAATIMSTGNVFVERCRDLFYLHSKYFSCISPLRLYCRLDTGISMKPKFICQDDYLACDEAKVIKHNATFRKVLEQNSTMSGKAAPNRRVAAIQAKKKRKNPKRKGNIHCR